MTAISEILKHARETEEKEKLAIYLQLVGAYSNQWPKDHAYASHKAAHDTEAYWVSWDRVRP